MTMQQEIPFSANAKTEVAFKCWVAVASAEHVKVNAINLSPGRCLESDHGKHPRPWMGVTPLRGHGRT